MTQPETPRVIGVRHVGLSARDPAALAEFYRDVLGLQVVPADTAALGATAFLEKPFELDALLDLIKRYVQLDDYTNPQEGSTAN